MLTNELQKSKVISLIRTEVFDNVLHAQDTMTIPIPKM